MAFLKNQAWWPLEKSNGFKACVCYFLLFSPNDSTSKTVKKCFLFHLKTSFRSEDVQIFVFDSPLIFSLSDIAPDGEPR